MWQCFKGPKNKAKKIASTLNKNLNILKSSEVLSRVKNQHVLSTPRAGSVGSGRRVNQSRLVHTALCNGMCFAVASAKSQSVNFIDARLGIAESGARAETAIGLTPIHPTRSVLFTRCLYIKCIPRTTSPAACAVVMANLSCCGYKPHSHDGTNGAKICLK